jgi:hypothetical protein
MLQHAVADTASLFVASPISYWLRFVPGVLMTTYVIKRRYFVSLTFRGYQSNVYHARSFDLAMRKLIANLFGNTSVEALSILGSAVSPFIPGYARSQTLSDCEDLAALLMILFSHADSLTKRVAFSVWVKRPLERILFDEPYISEELQRHFNMVLVHLEPVLDKMNTEFQTRQPESLEECLSGISRSLSGVASFSKQIASKRAVQAMTIVVGLYLTCRDGFSGFDFDRLAKSIYDGQFIKTTNFLEATADSLDWLLKTGLNIYHNGRIELPYRDVEHIQHTVRCLSRVIDHVDCLDTFTVPAFSLDGVTTPEQRWSFFELQQNVDLAISHVRTKLPQLRAIDTRLFKATENHLAELLEFQSRLTRTKLSVEQRQVPFALLFFGGSGIGKSSLLSMTGDFCARRLQLPTGSEYTYTVPATAKYWDGFRSFQHTIILDDLATVKPNSKQEDRSIGDIIRVINNVAYNPDQAALENKGMQPVLSRFAFGTTNTKNLNAGCLFSNPQAVLRRFPYVITPTLKDRFIGPDGKFKSDGTVGYIDAWEFHVELVVLRGGGNSTDVGYQTICHCSNLVDFLEWLGGAVDDHFISQRLYLNSMASIRQQVFCEHGLPSSLCNTCVQATAPAPPAIQSKRKVESLSVPPTLFYRGLVLLIPY